PRCGGVGHIVEKPCRGCGGEGRLEKPSRIKLKVPAGIADGSRLRSSRNGEAGIRGGPHGDLYVVVHVQEHKIFQREEDNLYCEVPIPFSVATLGGEVPVPTLEGKANLKVPAGTQSGQMFKLRGKGIIHVNGRERGDLLVRVMVEVPTRDQSGDCRSWMPPGGRIGANRRRTASSEIARNGNAAIALSHHAWAGDSERKKYGPDRAKGGRDRRGGNRASDFRTDDCRS